MTMCVCKQDNGLPLTNATQLRARCDVLVAEEHGRVRGVASTYHDLPIPNLTFVVRSSDIAGALTLGPAFGCFVDHRLVAMAATHFTTPEVIEIGHVATHPEHRRQGFASACTAALTRAAFKLAPRVFLMVLEHNTAALATYRRLGFRVMERMYLTRFAL